MRVLIAEDDATSRMIVEGLLTKWGYEPMSAADGEEAWKILSSDEGPSLAVIDWILPGIEGPELCRRLRASKNGAGRYAYVILLTVRGGMINLLEGFEAGADDYLTKPFDPLELRARLRVGHRILELQEALRYSADHDFLTGLVNRRAIFSDLMAEISRTRRGTAPLSVAMFDIDHFKAVNDTYGHQTGDEVLVEVGRCIRERLRPYDTVGRFGGEEFLAILPGATEDAAVEVCERVRYALAANPVQVDGKPLVVTLSAGVATWQESQSGDELVRRADEGLYKAKRTGRDRVCRASELME